MGYNNHTQNGPHDYHGPTKAQGSKEKSTSQVNATQSKQSKGQNDTKGGQLLALPGTSSRELNILKLCI
jgi:hypothetical protein